MIDNIMTQVAEGFEKKWDDHFAQSEEVRRRNLFNIRQAQKPKPQVPLQSTFKKGEPTGGAVDRMRRILGPHGLFRECMSEMMMLFRGIDTAGERRKAEAARLAEAEELRRKAETDAIDNALTKQMGLLEGQRAAAKKMKWYEKLDENGELANGGGDVDRVDFDAAGQVKFGDHEATTKKVDQWMLNHRSFHYVLTFTRGRFADGRNLRQQTHLLKRVVCAELTRKVYNDERLWFNKWNEQEGLLTEAVETYINEIKERQEDAKKEGISVQELVRRETRVRRSTRKTRRSTLRRASALQEESSNLSQTSFDNSVTSQEEERELTVFEKLAESLKSSLPLPMSYPPFSFFHKLLKYNRNKAFSRPKWVTWQAKREHMRDLLKRKSDLEEETKALEYTYDCPLAFKHPGNPHCKTCNRRVLRNKAMWLTDITEPKTRLENLQQLDFCLQYCQEEAVKNASEIKKYEEEIFALEIALFDSCAEYLQGKYAMHRGYFYCKGREESVLASMEEYRDRRFEEMCKNVRDGRNDTEALYIRYADIGDKLQKYLHYHAALRRRRLRFAAKRIIRIWRQRKANRLFQKKLEEEEKSRQQREHLKMVRAEEEAVKAAIQRKGLDDMRKEVAKRLEKHYKDNMFVCTRRECNGRTFHSRELFQLHEKLHYQADVKANKIKEQKRMEADMRLHREKLFMEDLKSKREERLKKTAEKAVATGSSTAGGVSSSSSVSNGIVTMCLPADTTNCADLDQNPENVDDASLASGSVASFEQMDVEEFFRVTSPSSFPSHIQHFQDRPSSPSVPKLFLNEAFSGVSMNLQLDPEVEPTNELGEGDDGLLSSNVSSLQSSARAQRPVDLPRFGPVSSNTDVEKIEDLMAEEERRLAESVDQLMMRDYAYQTEAGDDQSVAAFSLTSSITDDFMSEQDLASARSSVTGVELEDALQELHSVRKLHDNFSSPRLVLMSTHVMTSEDLPTEFYLNKSLIRVGRSDKCDIALQPMINLHMIAKVHMLIYTTWNDDGTIEVYVRDNRTKYGTFMLNENGVTRCPALTALVDHSFHMKHGDKLLVARDFHEDAPYEIIYKLYMPGGEDKVVEKMKLASPVKEHLNEIPHLVPRTGFWWEEDGDKTREGEGRRTATNRGTAAAQARRKIASRIERLRKVANGEKVSVRVRGSAGRDAVSLPDLLTREGAGRFNSSSSLAGSSIAESDANSFSEDLQSINSLSLLSSDDGSGGGSLGAGDSQIGSVRSMPSLQHRKEKTRFMLTSVKGDRDEIFRKRKGVQKRFSALYKDRSEKVKRALGVVDGKVIILQPEDREEEEGRGNRRKEFGLL